MKTRKKLLTAVSSLAIAAMVLLTGCGGTAQSEVPEVNETGVITLSVNPEIKIEYDKDGLVTGITGASVYAVGYDDDFILVKAYRALKDSMGISLQRFNKNTTEYYIIPVNNAQEAWEAQENKYGAFSKKDFEVKRKELGVSDDITFKRL